MYDWVKLSVNLFNKLSNYNVNSIMSQYVYFENFFFYRELVTKYVILRTKSTVEPTWKKGVIMITAWAISCYIKFIIIFGRF